MKKVLSLMLTLVMAFGLFTACRGGEASSVVESSGEGSAAVDPSGGAPTSLDGDFKIGIVTGTVSQGEEEYVAAVNIATKYGADRVVTKTYPDNFDKETETYISIFTELASDPDIKAIVVCQSVIGTSAAIDKVRETRDDILFVAGVPSEDPEMIASKADVVLLIDEAGTGREVVKQAKKLGAETFVHYSFPRHLGMPTIQLRLAEMKKAADEEGIEFVEVTAPDPLSDSGVTGAQQFMKEDVPRQVEKYGKDTAFFSTNCSMQEPLIRTVLEEQAIFPQQCCPSPYHGYPGALGINVKGHEGDIQYMLDQTAEKVAAGGNAGRMSTWKFPVNMLMVDFAFEYAVAYCEGKTDGRTDDAFIKDLIATTAQSYNNATCEVSYYTTAEGEEFDNFYVLLGEFETF